MRLIAPNSGTYYQIETFDAPRYAQAFDLTPAPEELQGLLTRDDCLFIPCRTPAQRMIAQKELIARHLDQGGTVVAMGESQSQLWLPQVRFHHRPTNWWWWLEDGADLGVTITAPDHPLMKGMTKADVSWHIHGHFDLPQGAKVLIQDADGKALMYLDDNSHKGRLLVTSLDPIYHHGSHFMPATTRFLDRFLPNLRHWLAA